MLIRLSLLLISLNTYFMVVSNQTVSTAATILSQTTIRTEDTCGDWESFKNEKCFKLLPNIDTYENAIHLCRAQSSYATLASIRSKEEQEFIQKLVFDKYNSVDSVWIGGSKNNSKQKFQWEDGSEFNFVNWEDSGFSRSGNDCIEMQTEVGYANSNKLGKWAQVSCQKRNLVLCQFMQNWSTSHIETAFLDLKLKVEATIDKLNEKIEILSKNEDSNSVPVGFVYFQLPAQPEPKNIWSSFEWHDISESYAGLFFRVVGGNSSSFGTVQEPDCPQLTDISDIQTNGYPSITSTTPSYENIVKSVSLCFYSCQSNYHNILFKFSKREVRPRNQAIRVWKRIK